MYLKEDHHSNIHNFKYAVAKRKPEKKIQACTEFEALTSAIPMQRYTRGALCQDYWMVAKHVKKKNAGKPRFLGD